VRNLVPIGRFSTMTRLSVKALRHYDEIGLLVPAEVDRSSGYRYYRYEQANRAEAIRILRRLDMPLDEIRQLLDAEPDVGAKLLQAHRGRLEDELDRHRRMLAYLERLIERDEGVMPYEVGIKDVPAQHVARLRRSVSLATMSSDVGEGFARIWEALGPAADSVSGPSSLTTLDPFDEEMGGEVELAVPLAAPFEGDDVSVRGADVPAMTVAWALHHGPYDEIGPAYHTIAGWIQEHGHELAGPTREVYLTDPNETPDVADYLTEVQFPIR
jgi:DNA-binding transcriptional MerR regulator